MANDAQNFKQIHPLEHLDGPTLDRIKAEGPTDLNLAEVARLRIRYEGFLGADRVQERLTELLSLWKLTPDELYAKTRAIHARGNIYRQRNDTEEGSSWDISP
jgi:hypothetical protein